jgi:hypothetical protein
LNICITIGFPKFDRCSRHKFCAPMFVVMDGGF